MKATKQTQAKKFSMMGTFGVVQRTRKNEADAVPTITALSSDGGFRLTGAVTRFLEINSGDNVMFITNQNSLDAIIASQDNEYVDFCKNNGFEVGSPEAAIALHKEFDMFAIAKALPVKDSRGNVVTVQERITKAEKHAFVKQNFQEMYDNLMASDDKEAQIAINVDGISREEQEEILMGYIVPKPLPKFMGSKSMNTSNKTGIGNTLQFTDVSMWMRLKEDLEDKNAVNRIFSLNFDEVQTIPVHDGYEFVEVKALILGESEDHEPKRRGAEAAETSEESNGDINEAEFDDENLF